MLKGEIFGLKRDPELQLHGTYRRKDRLYREDTFYGTGKKLSEASDAEREADLKVCILSLFQFAYQTDIAAKTTFGST